MPKTYNKKSTSRKPMYYSGGNVTRKPRDAMAMGGITRNMPNIMGQSLAQGMPQDKIRKNAFRMRMGGKARKR